MINSLLNEIMLVKVSRFVGSDEKVETIYFGGGTPSLLSVDDIKLLLNAIHENFPVSINPEITMEANPDDINENKLAGWKSIGINRFSIGIQSFHQQDLTWMNRAHNAEQALRCIQQVKAAGFGNYSVDLIYGTPTLSDIEWEKNVQTTIALDVPHISCYALTVEPNTALHKMISLHTKESVDPDKQVSQFMILSKLMLNAGYEHYEISNFAKPGFRSKHNSSYWQGKSYTGIGPSAHSFNGNSRRWNVSNNALYIQSIQKNIIPYEEEILSAIQRLNEYIMTSLRTLEGIDLYVIKTKFGEEMIDAIFVAAAKHIENDKLKNCDGKLILTTTGKLFADGIASDLFFEEN